MTQTKEELDQLDREWRAGFVDMYDEIALLLLHGGLGVIPGWARSSSQFGVTYELMGEEAATSEAAREMCLAFFQKIVDRYDGLVQDAKGDPMTVYDSGKQSPALVVFRRAPAVESFRDFETKEIKHRWSARYHVVTFEKYAEWWHPIVFSHEPGRRHGG